MPANPKIDPKSIFEVLSHVEIFDNDQNLKPRTDIIWTNASLKLNKLYSGETLNFLVRNNRWNLKIDLKKHFGLKFFEIDVMDGNYLEKSVAESEYLPCNLKKDINPDYPPIFFNLNIPDEEWVKIRPLSKLYKERGTKGRKYKVLQSGWTDVLAKACFLKSKVPCAFSFSSAKVYNSEESQVYLDIRGICNECGSTLRAHCLTKPLPGKGIVLRVYTADTSGIPHDSKRKITGRYRREIGEDLLTVKPRQWQLQAVEDLSFGDPVPPYHPRKSTLRKIKEEAINHDLGIGNSTTPIESILDLKHTRLSGIIHDVGIDRFHCFYWTPSQMTLYKELIKVTKKIEIDATGQLVKSIKKQNGELRHIFLYQVVLKAVDGIQPVFQMLSEKQDTNFICYWLREILRDGAPIPQEIDCDYSMALLNTTCFAFKDCKLATYLKHCLRYLTSGTLQHPLRCFIRIDIAHLIKIICKKNIFDGKLKKVKDFYVRSVGLMSTCEQIQDFANLLTAVIVVAYSEYSGKNKIGQSSYCEERLDFLLNRIETFSAPENEMYSERDYDHLEDRLDENQEIFHYIEKIHMTAKQKVTQSEETENLNAFYCPGIVSHTLKLAKHFPLWTNVMIRYFPQASDVASSARCEAYFRDLQHSDLGSDYQVMRADKFLVKHVKSIDSISKLECAALKRNMGTASFNEDEKRRGKKRKSNSGKSIANHDKSDENDHLNAQENWFGLNPDAKIEKLNEILEVSTEKEDDNTSLEMKNFPDVNVNEIDEEQEFLINTKDTSKMSQLDNSGHSIYKCEKNTIKNSTFENDENVLSLSQFITCDSLEKANESDQLSLNTEQENNKEKESCSRDKDSKSVEADTKLSSSDNNNRKRGTYLSACPDIRLNYNRPVSRRKSEILLNGNLCSLIVLEGIKVHVRNTCGLDSALEVLANSYRNYPVAKEIIDNNTNNMVYEFVIKYVREGISPNLYHNRAVIASTCFETKNGIIDCWTALIPMFQKLLVNTPSVINKKECSGCKHQRTTSEVAVEMEPTDFTLNFADCLTAFIDNYFNVKTEKCRKCKSTVNCTTKTAPILFFEMDLFFALRKNLIIKKVNLDEIPQRIEIAKKMYILNGVIAYNRGHFTAFCRAASGIWTEYDDRYKNARKSVKNTKTLMIKAQVLVYVEI